MAYKRIRTTSEVYWAIVNAHSISLSNEISVFESYSDPDGRAFGGGGERGHMFTVWGLKGSDYPLCGAESHFDIVPYRGPIPPNLAPKTMRANEETEYFLCCNTKDDE